MSCENKPGYVARVAGRISGGISQLAGKRGFYAGLGLGGAGLTVAGLVKIAKRRSDPAWSLFGRGMGNDNKPVANDKLVIKTTSVPALPDRKTAKAIAPSATDICAGCNTSAQSKKGEWFSIDRKKYCQDCALGVANQTGTDLTASSTFKADIGGDRSFSPAGASRREAGGSYINDIDDGGDDSEPQTLPLNQPVDTKLVKSRLRVALGESEQGPIWGQVQSGFVLARSGARTGQIEETGLAITPAVVVSPSSDTGGVEVREDCSRWGILHVPSGRMVSGKVAGNQLVNGWPYESAEEAAAVASVLARQAWDRDIDAISQRQIAIKNATLDMYTEVKSNQKRIERGDPLKDYSPGPKGNRRPISIPTRKSLPGDESVEGYLVVEPQYGGIARVVSDDLNLLFLVDAQGQRYEIPRSQAKFPSELDFESFRVAMPVDPRKYSGDNCAMCSGPASQSSSGRPWYKMNSELVCDSCAPDRSLDVDFIMPEEIHNDMP